MLYSQMARRSGYVLVFGSARGGHHRWVGQVRLSRAATVESLSLLCLCRSENVVRAVRGCSSPPAAPELRSSILEALLHSRRVG